MEDLWFLLGEPERFRLPLVTLMDGLNFETPHFNLNTVTARLASLESWQVVLSLHSAVI